MNNNTTLKLKKKKKVLRLYRIQVKINAKELQYSCLTFRLILSLMTAQVKLTLGRGMDCNFEYGMKGYGLRNTER